MTLGGISTLSRPLPAVHSSPPFHFKESSPLLGRTRSRLRDPRSRPFRFVKRINFISLPDRPQYHQSMEPVSAIAAAAFKLVNWQTVLQNLATDSAKKGAGALLGRLKPDERDKAARKAIELFAHEFLGEIEDKTPLSSALPGYADHLKRLIEHAAPEITRWLEPDIKEVDLAPVQRIWSGLAVDPLPEDFDWSLVAKNYPRELRKYVRSDANLREMLNTALLEKQTELQQASATALNRIAGVDCGFDLAAYRNYLRKKCGLLQLSAMHTSTHAQRINLWSVFVPQSVRRSQVRDLTSEYRSDQSDVQVEDTREAHQASPVIPVFDFLRDTRLSVVLGDPGSGKTSLLKYLVMRWVNQEPYPLPLWIDMKEYATERIGLLKYCEAGHPTFHLDSLQLDDLLKDAQASLYLDGLDEIFDGPTRGSVIEEIAAFSEKYPKATLIVTSRSVGYQADRLANADFKHATLEDLDDEQIQSFITQWHKVAEADEKNRSRLQIQLETALRESKSVRELAGNPLLLTMMAILNRTQPLPRDRVELYAQASRVLLHEWDASRSLHVDTFARQKRGTAPGSSGAMQQEQGLAGNLIDLHRLVDLFRIYLKNLGIVDFHDKANALVKQLTERNFILCLAGGDLFRFVHRTFLEYFCAAWFVDRFEKKRTMTLDQLKTEVFGSHWQDESWHEVLRLISGMLGEAHAGELIEFLIGQEIWHSKLSNLLLAAECLSGVRNRRRISDIDAKLQKLLMQQVTPYNPSYFHEPSYSALGPSREKAVTLLASVWRQQEVQSWLTDAIKRDTDWIVRTAALKGLARGWKDDAKTHGILRDHARFDRDPAVRSAALQELARGWTNELETLPLIREGLSHDESPAVRRLALIELARGWKNHSGTLSLLLDRARSDESGAVRTSALRELSSGWRDAPETLSLLLDRAHSDENGSVRLPALQELCSRWRENPQTLSLLLDRAHSDMNYDVRIAAIYQIARGFKEDPRTLPLLLDCIHSDGSEYVRSIAVREVARAFNDNPQTLPALLDRARSDEHEHVRRMALQELTRRWKHDPEVVQSLRFLTPGDTAAVAISTSTSGT